MLFLGTIPLVLFAFSLFTSQEHILIFNRQMSFVVAVLLVVTLMVSSKERIQQAKAYLSFLVGFMIFTISGRNIQLYQGCEIGVLIYLLLFVIYLYNTGSISTLTSKKEKQTIITKEKPFEQ